MEKACVTVILCQEVTLQIIDLFKDDLKIFQSVKF